VITVIAAIPLLLVKLWTVYPRLFEWPPARSIAHALERLSIAVLVAAALVELTTGLLNVLGWYAWPWGFVFVHRQLGYVVIGALAVHVAVKLPVIRSALARPLPAQPADGLSRRGLLLAGAAGAGVVAATTVGQVVGPLEPIALLAPRRPRSGPLGVAVNRTAAAAGIGQPDGTWRLSVLGPEPYDLDLAALEALPSVQRSIPLACVEGWSVSATWRGPRLLDVLRRAGGDESARVRVVSAERHGSFSSSLIDGPQLAQALLATHLNGQRITLDHGYPVRLIAPNRAGVLNTKWITRLEIG
jgi:DMSO/TMAO reductase YedYZ molybdopterin-dependent catalytic subunit